MLLALQASSEERRCFGLQAAVSPVIAPPPVRPTFTVASFAANNGPCLEAFLSPNSNLNALSLLRILSDDDDRTLSLGAAVAVGPPPPLTPPDGQGSDGPRPPRPHPTGKYAKDPRVHSDSDDDDEEADPGALSSSAPVIFNPQYDADRRQVVVCRGFPADGRSERALTELTELVFFAALARDDPRHIPIPSGEDAPGPVDAENEVAFLNEAKRSSAVQRVIAHHLMRRLVVETRFLQAHPRSPGVSPNALDWSRCSIDSSAEPTQVALSSSVRASIRTLLDDRWGGGPTEAEVDRAVSTVTSVLECGPLVAPSYATLVRLWGPRQASTTSTASSSFPQDRPTLVRIAAHAEELRWRLVRSIVDGRLHATVRKEVAALDRRLKVLKLQPSFSASEAEVPLATSTEAFPSSIVGYFHSDKAFRSTLQLVREVLAGGSSQPPTLTEKHIDALMFLDAVIFDIERSRKGHPANTITLQLPH